MGTKQKVMVCSGGEKTQKEPTKKFIFVTMIIKQYLIVTFYVSFSYKKTTFVTDSNNKRFKPLKHDGI